MHAVTLATFNDPEPAEPLKRRLQETGIPAEILDERELQRFFFLSRPLAGIRVRVDKSHYARAEELANQWDHEAGLLRGAVRCPDCGSSRIEYPQFSRRFTWCGLAAIAAALGFFEKKFFCKQCQFTWPVAVKLEPARDILGWPKKPSERKPEPKE